MRPAKRDAARLQALEAEVAGLTKVAATALAVPLDAVTAVVRAGFDDAVRLRTIEECAKVADAFDTSPVHMALAGDTARQIADNIRALAAPKEPT